jgi:hypothetical protein
MTIKEQINAKKVEIYDINTKMEVLALEHSQLNQDKLKKQTELKELEAQV